MPNTKNRPENLCSAFQISRTLKRWKNDQEEDGEVLAALTSAVYYAQRYEAIRKSNRQAMARYQKTPAYRESRHRSILKKRRKARGKS